MDLQQIKQLYKDAYDEVQERSKNKNPMYYRAVERLRYATIIQSLAENGDLTQQAQDALDALTGVKTERVNLSVDSIRERMSKEVRSGAEVLPILDKYRHKFEPETKCHDMLEDIIKEKGLHVRGLHII